MLVGWAWMDVRGGWEEDVIGVSWKWKRVGTGLDGCISWGKVDMLVGVGWMC